MHYYAEISKPFSPAMVRRYRRDGNVVVYVHPDGPTAAMAIATNCGVPEAAVTSVPPGGFEPLPQFEQPLPVSWRHMLPGPERDAAIADANRGTPHRKTYARRGAGRRSDIGY